ncbi:uncharacterized protein LOC122651028 [Telopea speciosissima]|uniref:uncharacterized protein LOC122651028 n=1 Tax=Telopea speciosissima TaxID=54955 RepID=UPI001CC43A47|nr:uncharacterized protein LOC122651028 [Telopea speciosissima]
MYLSQQGPTAPPQQISQTEAAASYTNNRHPRRLPQRVPTLQTHRINNNSAYEEDEDHDGNQYYRDDKHKVKLDLKEYNGKHDPIAFHDWLSALDDYFKWFRLSEDRKMQLATTKLIGGARDWWRTHEDRLIRRHMEPITWAAMKEILKEKYLPPSYQRRLHDQLNTIRQGTLTVEEYIDKFNDLLSRTGVDENDDQLISRFKLGLRVDIKDKIGVVEIYNLNHCFEKAMDAEDLIKAAPPRFTTQSGDIRRAFTPNRSSGFPTRAPPTTEEKGKAPMGSQTPNKCFHCQQDGHYARYCPQRGKSNSVIAAMETSPDVQVCDPQFNDNWAVNAALEGEDYDDTLEDQIYEVNVVTRILVAESKGEDWRRHCIFYTLMDSGTATAQVIVDSGNCVNVVSKAFVIEEKLKAEPHPQPYKVSLLNKDTLEVNQRCSVPLKIFGYEETVWCDIIPMILTDVLLGRPWMYDNNVLTGGTKNQCFFDFKGKPLVLNPSMYH